MTRPCVPASHREGVLGVREIVMGLIGVLLAYLLWLVLRWMRLSRKGSRKDSRKRPLFAEPTLSPALETLLPGDPEPAAVRRNALREEARAADRDDDEADDEAEDDAPVELYTRPRPPAEPAPPAVSPVPFDALLEMRQTRHHVDALAQEIESLKQELVQLRQELTDMRAASRVSPQYGEAVSLARRGLDAQAIAERCGISVSEAELVRSLLSLSPSGD